MHPFSIDFITSEGGGKKGFEGCDKGDGHNDSGMESSSSLSPGQTYSRTDSTDSELQTLLSLDRQSPKPASSDEKPPQSYIALISMAILDSPEKKALLCDIYQYIMDHFAYYNNKDKAWRNSIRHNLSLNECFMKNGRADNGKGNYWSIHPACEPDFAKGDFRRRHARRRVRKSIKDSNPSGVSPGYRCNVGYVPMTSSPVGYHPYGGPSLYYQPPVSFGGQVAPLNIQTSDNYMAPSAGYQQSGLLQRPAMPESHLVGQSLPIGNQSLQIPAHSFRIPPYPQFQ